MRPTPALATTAWLVCGCVAAPLALAVTEAPAPAESLIARARAPQAPAELPLGTRVRVELRSRRDFSITPAPRREIGAIAAWRADSLVLDRGSRGPVAVPLATVRRLEVSRGPAVWGGAGRGAVIGLWGGTLAAAVSLGLFEPPDGFVPGTATLFFVGGPLGGAALGALVGAAFPTERWERRR